MSDIIYLDHASTAPVRSAAFEAMRPFFLEGYANPNSIHVAGERVRSLLEDARGLMARQLGCRAAELYFSSGATESINWALRGVIEARPERRRLVTTAVEHSVTLDVARRLEKQGVEVVVLPVEADGSLAPERVAEALDENTALLSILWTNNETGVVFDVDAIGAIARERGVIVHVDAVQAVGKGLPPLRDLPIDLMSFSGHKFGAAKGVGGLYAARGVSLRPLIWGGHQESGRRSGTENVAGVIGMAAALEEACAEFRVTGPELRKLRDELEAAIVADHPEVLVNGAGAPRNETILNVAFRAIEGHGVVLHLAQRGIYCSSGSACTAQDDGPSHVMSALGLPGSHVHGAVRFSLGPGNDAAQMVELRSRLAEAVTSLSRISP